MARESSKTWLEVEVLRRSKFDDGWQVESTDDGTKAWVNDEQILDVDGPDLAVGVVTKIELAVGYAESKGLA